MKTLSASRLPASLGRQYWKRLKLKQTETMGDDDILFNAPFTTKRLPQKTLPISNICYTHRITFRGSALLGNQQYTNWGTSQSTNVILICHMKSRNVKYLSTFESVNHSCMRYLWKYLFPESLGKNSAISRKRAILVTQNVQCVVMYALLS